MPPDPLRPRKRDRPRHPEPGRLHALHVRDVPGPHGRPGRAPGRAVLREGGGPVRRTLHPVEERGLPGRLIPGAHGGRAGVPGPRARVGPEDADHRVRAGPRVPADPDVEQHDEPANPEHQ